MSIETDFIFVQSILITYKSEPQKPNRTNVLIKKELGKTFRLGHIYFENSSTPFVVNKVESSEHIYEFFDETRQLEITNKSTNISVASNGSPVFKPTESCAFIFSKIFKLQEKLFGLEDVEEQIRQHLDTAGNQMICLYGPTGCGRTMLMKKLHDSMEHKKFVWLDYFRLCFEKNYLGNTESNVRRIKTNIVLCIEDFESIQSDYPDMNELYVRLLKDPELDITILARMSDYGLVKLDKLKHMMRPVLVRTLNRDEIYKMLRYLIDTSSAPGEPISNDDLAKFAGTLNGFTGKDVLNFVECVELERSLTLANLIAAKRDRDYVPYHLQEFITDVAPLRWADIGGYDSVKRKLQHQIEIPLRNGRTPHAKGILLHGPPGCSKTMFARALATECGLYLFNVRPTSVLRGYVGESEKMMRQILIQAQAAAPSILFIDEIDTLLPRDNGTSSVTQGLLAELLSFLGGLRSSSANGTVIFMGATNFPNKLDQGLTRSGRVDLNIAIDLPDQSSREAIIRLVFADNAFSVSPGVISNIADRLANKSGAEIVDFGKRIKTSANVARSMEITLNDVSKLLGLNSAVKQ